MLDITQDIQPLTTFRNNSVKMMKQLKKTGRPIILTVNGKAEATVLSAAAYQLLLDLASAADEREGLRQGLEDLAASRTYPAEQVFSEIRKNYALQR
jgi:prevent-host-death family protein